MVQIPRWQIIVALAALLLGFLFAVPNLLRSDSAEALPNWLPKDQINLGLDLSGGSYLLLEVDLASVVEEQIDNVVETVRGELRKERIGYTGLGRDGQAVVFELRDPATGARVRELLRDLGTEARVSISDNGAGRIELSEKALQERRRAVLQQSLEIVRRRIDETGTREPSIQQQGADRILVQLPGLENPERVKQLIGKTARLTFQLVNEEASSQQPAPPGSEVLPLEDKRAGAGAAIVVRKRIMVDGENLVDAQPTFENGRPVVSFRFDTVGARRFGQATQENVGRRFAIVLDEKVISAPVIREPILGGRGIISGDFTVESAQDLALLLRAGALPAPLKVLEERTVGPGLGADSIRAGAIASVLGFVLVVGFMIAAYGLFGVMASLALVANLILLLAALSGLQATLTLPGIAGIVLTMGMAVDANVLIFERIREEVRAGRGIVSSIDAGYRRAMATIIDSNLTTLIAALLLFHFGTGPIKGFAVTLSIGIITSMFSAIMLTRLLVVAWLRQRRPQALPI